MSEQAVLEVGTRVEIAAIAPSHTPCMGERGEIVKLTEPGMMALVRLDGSYASRIYWVEELRALPALKEEVCT